MAPYFPGTALYPGTALWPEYNGELQPQITAATATYDSTTVSFSGTIVPKSDLRTYWWFEFGTTTSYGTEAPVVPGNAGTAGTVAVSHTELIDHYEPGVFGAGTLYYQLTAWNGAGTASTPGTADFVLWINRQRGTITLAGDTFDSFEAQDGLGGTVSLGGDIKDSYYRPISEFAFRRWFVHEAQGVQ